MNIKIREEEDFIRLGRGRKLYPGDIVSFETETFQIIK